MAKTIIGLTGTVGSGKSTVAAFFTTQGATIINADDLGHAVLLTPAVKESLRQAFGDLILNEKGEISRARLAATAFSNADNVAILNRTTQPPLLDKIRAAIVAAPDHGVTVVDAALIVEWGPNLAVDAVVVVDAPRPIRKARTPALTPGEFDARERAQLSPAAKRRVAAAVIMNDGDLTNLKKKTLKLYSLITNGLTSQITVV